MRLFTSSYSTLPEDGLKETSLKSVTAELQMNTIFDPRGVPVAVQTLNDVAGLETALIGMLGMDSDPLASLPDSDGRGRSVASLLLECVWRLSSMEDAQIIECKEILSVIDSRYKSLPTRELLHYSACRKWAYHDFEGAHED